MGDSNKKANAPQPFPVDARGVGRSPTGATSSHTPSIRPPLVVSRRKGGFTREEKGVIYDAYVAGEEPAAVAVRMGRPEETVRRQFDTLAAKGVSAAGVAPPPPTKTKREEVLQALHDSPQWRAVRDKFEPHEVRLYEDNYALLLEQFGDDVVVTERLQVDRYLTGLILADRNLGEQKRVWGELRMARDELLALRVQFPDGIPVGNEAGRKVMFEDIEDRYREQHADLTKAFNSLEATNRKMLEDLKGTRTQRLQNVEARSNSFLDVVKELMQEDKRVGAGRQAALFRQAALKKAAELAEPVKFADGTVGRPLMNSETVSGGEGAEPR